MPDVIVGETYSMATNVVPIVELPRPEIHAGSATFPGALFGIDSAHIGPDIDAALKVVVAQALTTGSRLVVIGRTDAITGTVEHNYQLSYARAEAIAMWLIKLGLPPRQVTFSGVGGADASATAELADPAVVARDRRVDITFEKQPRFQ